VNWTPNTQKWTVDENYVNCPNSGKPDRTDKLSGQDTHSGLPQGLDNELRRQSKLLANMVPLSGSYVARQKLRWASTEEQETGYEAAIAAWK